MPWKIRCTGTLRLDLDRANRRRLWAAAVALAALAFSITIPVQGTAAASVRLAKSAHANALAHEAWPARLKPASQTHLHIRGASAPCAALSRAPIIAELPQTTHAVDGDEECCRGARGGESHPLLRRVTPAPQCTRFLFIHSEGATAPVTHLLFSRVEFQVVSRTPFY